jgi:hypothetical protein
MTRPRGPRYAALAFAVLGFACGDAPTAPDAGQESLTVSLAGLSSDDAGVVLELTGGADLIEPARASLEVAWAGDATTSATVAIVGPLAAGADVLVVRRRAGLGPLRVKIREVASADGAVASPVSVRAILQVVHGP